MTANAMLSVALKAEIMLSGFSFSDLWKIRLRYGKLTKAVSYRCCSDFCSFKAELFVTVVEPPNFYYHLTTIHCRDLPGSPGFPAEMYDSVAAQIAAKRRLRRLYRPMIKILLFKY